MTSPSQLRIVHIDTGQELRGGQRQLLLLAQGLRERGHIQLLVCREESALEARALCQGFPVFSLPAHDPWHAHGILLLRRELQTEPFDILHAHDGRGQDIAWLASMGMAVQRVASRRVTFLPSDRWTFRLKYNYTCDAVIAVSQFVKSLAVSAGIPESKLEVIPDAVEIPAELPSAEARRKARQRWGLEEQDFVMGHVGAFTGEKGQDVALEAFLRVREKLPQAHLLLLGEGPMRQSPEVMAGLAQSRGSARALGSLENLDEFFPALDLYLMPSRSEGLGSSALLAMACGLAVAASRVGGLPEIIEEGVTGWLVAPGSAQALAEAVLAAASTRERLRAFGLNARARAREFSVDIMRDRTEALYRRLVLRPSL